MIAVRRRYRPDNSVTAAVRAFVQEQFISSDLIDWLDDAQLVISELVTNVIIHARTEFEVRLITLPDPGVRIEVEDGCPILPVPGTLTSIAISGRGLLLVEALATRWGAEALPGAGKMVWCELGGRPCAAASGRTGTHDRPWGQPAARHDEQVQVVLEDMPVTTFVAAKAHFEDVLREVQLILIADTAGRTGPRDRPLVDAARCVDDAAQSFADGHGQLRAQVLAASARGDSVVTVRLQVSPTAVTAVRQLREAVDAIERLAQATGGLLTLDPPVADGVNRRGGTRPDYLSLMNYLDQIIEQLAATPQARRPQGGSVPAVSLRGGRSREQPIMSVVDLGNIAGLSAADGQTDRASPVDYRYILDGLFDAVLAVDLHGIITFANAACQDLFGYILPELVGRPVEVLVPAAVRRHHHHLRHDYLKAPEPRAMAEGRQLSAVRSDGTTIPVQVALNPLLTVQGHLTIVVVRDLSAHEGRRQAERTAQQLGQALRLSEQAFRLAFDEAHVGMMIINARPQQAGEILQVNPALCRLVGRSRDELVGQPTQLYIPVVDPDQDVEAARRTRADHTVVAPQVERRIVHADGHEIWVQVTASVVCDEDGEPDYFFVSQILDITQQRRDALEARRRIERDRRIATVLQQGLLPQVPAQIGQVRVATRYQPAGTGEAVGGDWHDVFALPDGRVSLTVGDVAGHGIESAVAMFRLRHALRVLATSGASPAAVLTRLNNMTHDMTHDGDQGSEVEMATIMHAVLDPRTGRLTYCNAGHPPLIALSGTHGPRFDRDDPHPASDGQAPLWWPPAPGTAWPQLLLQDLSGPPLGAVPGLRYAQHEVVLPQGTTLIGFTDGLIERRRLPLDDGLNTLLCNLRSHLPATLHDPDRLAQAVLDSAPAGTRSDDTAVLIIALPRPDTDGTPGH